jgi:hypothetical protein
MYHDLFHEQLDHRLPVLKAELVDMPPQERAALDNIICDVFPFDGGVALLCQSFPLGRESLEPLPNLLAAGRQLLQRHNFLLICINEALQLPLHMLALHVDAVQLVLELALLPALYLLPQRIFL